MLPRTNPNIVIIDELFRAFCKNFIDIKEFSYNNVKEFSSNETYFTHIKNNTSLLKEAVEKLDVSIIGEENKKKLVEKLQVYIKHLNFPVLIKTIENFLYKDIYKIRENNLEKKLAMFVSIKPALHDFLSLIKITKNCINDVAKTINCDDYLNFISSIQKKLQNFLELIENVKPENILLNKEQCDLFVSIEPALYDFLILINEKAQDRLFIWIEKALLKINDDIIKTCETLMQQLHGKKFLLNSAFADTFLQVPQAEKVREESNFIKLKCINEKNNLDDFIFPLPPEDLPLKTFFESAKGHLFKQGLVLLFNQVTENATKLGISKEELSGFHHIGYQCRDYTGEHEENDQFFYPFLRFALPDLLILNDLLTKKEIKPAIKILVMRDLLSEIDVCLPGAHTHIYNTCKKLQAQLNFPMTLMLRRLSFVQALFKEDKNLLIKYRKELNSEGEPFISEGMETHFERAVLSPYAMTTIGINIPDKKLDPYLQEYEAHEEEYKNQLDIIREMQFEFALVMQEKFTFEAFINNVIAELNPQDLIAEINSIYHDVENSFSEKEKREKINQLIQTFESNLDAYGIDAKKLCPMSELVIFEPESESAYRLTWCYESLIRASLIERLFSHKEIYFNLPSITKTLPAGKSELTIKLFETMESLSFSTVTLTMPTYSSPYIEVKSLPVFFIETFLSENNLLREVFTVFIDKQLSLKLREKLFNESLFTYLNSKEFKALDSNEKQIQLHQLSTIFQVDDVFLSPANLRTQIINAMSEKTICIWLREQLNPKLVNIDHTVPVDTILDLLTDQKLKAVLSDNEMDAETLNKLHCQILNLAVRMNDKHKIEWLLKSQVEATVKNQSIFIACRKYNLLRSVYQNDKDADLLKKMEVCKEIIMLLYDHGADINANHFDTLVKDCAISTTFLSSAISAKDKDMIDCLLKFKEIHLNQFDNSNNTPLCIAFEVNDLTTIKKLLDRGADINLFDKKGKTLLYRIMEFKKPLDMLKNVLMHGANPNLVNNNAEQDTAFFYAIRKEIINAIKLFISHSNIDLNQKDSSGDTPLMIAAKNNNLALLEILLKAGANPNLVNNNTEQDTAFFYAIRNGNTEAIDLFIQHSKIDLYQRDKAGDTPLMIAAKNNNLAIMKLLVTKNNVIKDKSIATVLQIVITNKNSRMLELLLQAGADVGVISKEVQATPAIEKLFIQYSKNNSKEEVAPIAPKTIVKKPIKNWYEHNTALMNHIADISTGKNATRDSKKVAVLNDLQSFIKNNLRANSHQLLQTWIKQNTANPLEILNQKDLPKTGVKLFTQQPPQETKYTRELQILLDYLQYQPGDDVTQLPNEVRDFLTSLEVRAANIQ